MDMSGETLTRLLDIGETTNVGEGGYMQRLNADFEGGVWKVQGKAIDGGKTYHVVLPEFVAKGLEANLGFLSANTYETKDHFPSSTGTPTRNDIRDLVIRYMMKIKVWK